MNRTAKEFTLNDTRRLHSSTVLRRSAVFVALLAALVVHPRADADAAPLAHADAAASVLSIDPQSVCVLGFPFDLRITGTGFSDGMLVRIDGVAQPTNFIDSTTLIANVPGIGGPARQAAVEVIANDGTPVGSALPLEVTADVTSPVVLVPAPLVLMESAVVDGVHGATTMSAPQLASFLTASSAMDECSAVSLIMTFVDLQPVGSRTFFPAGESLVQWLYTDSSTNFGEGSSTVSVRRYGALLTLDGPTARDLALLNDIARGAAALPAGVQLAAADLNRNGRVDGGDVTLEMQALAGNVTLPAPLVPSRYRSAPVGPSAPPPPGFPTATVPLFVNLTNVSTAGHAANLIAFVVKVSFDPQKVALLGVKPRAGFSGGPVVMTTPVQANASGTAYVVGVASAGFGTGNVEVADLLVQEYAANGRATVASGVDTIELR